MIGDRFVEVLDEACAGSDAAVAELYRDLNPALLRFFWAQAQDVAEDLAQETWIAAGRQLRAFRGDERDFRSWMFTIGRRRLIEHWRRSGRRPSIPVDPETMTEVAEVDDPTEVFAAREAAAALVAGLPREQAEVILLRVVAGLDAEEVGAIIGKNAGAVRTLQHRALKRLAARLEQDRVTP